MQNINKSLHYTVWLHFDSNPKPFVQGGNVLETCQVWKSTHLWWTQKRYR